MSDRGDTMQRVQVGLIGLVAVLLLVSIGNYVSTQASDEQTALEEIQAGSGELVAGDPAADEEAPAEPLAELGITPAPAPEEGAVKQVAPNAGATGQTVPDLKPDPKLEAPMDREQR